MPASAATAVAAIIIITLGEIMSMPYMNSFWVSRTNNQNRGQYAAIYTIAWSIAQIAAPIVGSKVVIAYGYKAEWWLLAIICTATAFGFSLLGARMNKERKQIFEDA